MRARLAVIIAALAAMFLSLSLVTVSSAGAQVTRPAPLSARESTQRAAVPRAVLPLVSAIRLYTVRPGDTLSAIAARFCGSAASYPGLALASGIANPDRIYPGGRITLRCGGVTTGPAGREARPAAVRTSSRSAGRAESSGAYSVSSAFQACVIRAESGGDAQVWNHQGYPYWGLYQFGYATWVAHGGAGYLWGHAGAAYQTQIFWNTVRADGDADWRPSDGCALTAAHRTGPGLGTVHATLDAFTESAGARMLDWAESHALGHWYGWGGTGPAVFDCSGVIYAAGRALGSWPAGVRTTYQMIAWLYAHAREVPVSSAPRGALMFYGPGHVELNTSWPHTTFGAQQTGTRVGWHSWGGWWAPTMAFVL